MVMVTPIMHGGALLPHFRSPVSYQRGRGLGGLLRGIVRAVVPLFKKPIVRRGLKNLGKAAAASAWEATQRVAQEENPKAFVPAFKAAAKAHTIKAVADTLTGKGHGRKRKTVSRQRAVTKRRRGPSERDIFQALE